MREHRHSCPTPAGSAGRSAAATTPPSGRPLSGSGWRNGWPPRRSLRPGTVRSYAGHIRLYSSRTSGTSRIDRLRVTDVASVFDHIEELNDAITDARASGDPARRAAVKGRRLVGPATCQRIRATLRSAISTYMKQHPGVLPANVASLVELPPGRRPRPWSGPASASGPGRTTSTPRWPPPAPRGGRVSPVEIWIATPRPSPVMVWTPAQTTVFLDAARRHRLHALWRLIATRGLRRGEGCGLRRPDTDLDAALHHRSAGRSPSSAGSPSRAPPSPTPASGTVALDAGTSSTCAAHRRGQDKEREAAGDAWAGAGFEFTAETGEPAAPGLRDRRLPQLAYLAGLPPIRLHDLRHGAATLLLAAGDDMKVVQEILGLSSITIAADTYTSVLPQLARQSAEDVAALIRPASTASRARPRNQGRSRSTRTTARPTASARPAPRPGPAPDRPAA